MFSCEFCEISKNTFFTEHVWATASDCQAISLLSIFSKIYEGLTFNLARRVGAVILTPCWFSLNNSAAAKAVTLEFYSIQYPFMKDILANFGIPNLFQSPDIWQNSDKGISDFRISGQSLIKENCHKSKTSDDIDMEPGPKKLYDEVMAKNCDVNAFFPVYGEFGVIEKLDSGSTVCKTYLYFH